MRKSKRFNARKKNLNDWKEIVDHCSQLAEIQGIAMVFAAADSIFPEYGATIGFCGDKNALLALIHSTLLAMNDGDKKEMAKDLSRIVHVLVNER